jgi:hypothetical protein
MRTGAVILVASAATAALILPGTADATTRGDFVAQSEVLCAASNHSIEARSKHLYRKYKRLRPKGRFSDWTRGQRRHEESLYFGGYARALIFQGQAINALDKQLQLVPEAPGDGPVIDQWIESRRVDADLLKGAGEQLKRVARRKPLESFPLTFRFDGISDQMGLTDLIVGSYGFDQCLLEPEVF